MRMPDMKSRRLNGHRAHVAHSKLRCRGLDPVGNPFRVRVAVRQGVRPVPPETWGKSCIPETPPGSRFGPAPRRRSSLHRPGIHKTVRETPQEFRDGADGLILSNQRGSLIQSHLTTADQFNLLRTGIRFRQLKNLPADRFTGNQMEIWTTRTDKYRNGSSSVTEISVNRFPSRSAMDRTIRSSSGFSTSQSRVLEPSLSSPASVIMTFYPNGLGVNGLRTGSRPLPIVWCDRWSRVADAWSGCRRRTGLLRKKCAWSAGRHPGECSDEDAR